MLLLPLLSFIPSAARGIPSCSNDDLWSAAALGCVCFSCVCFLLSRAQREGSLAVQNDDLWSAAALGCVCFSCLCFLLSRAQREGSLAVQMMICGAQPPSAAYASLAFAFF